MPKLNTNNPEVTAYFSKICKYWVENWGIDGIRFDVGNEVSHTFLNRIMPDLTQQEDIRIDGFDRGKDLLQEGV